MNSIAAFVLALALVADASAQVFRAEPERPPRAQQNSGALSAPPPGEKRPFGAQPHRNAVEERCANFDKELRSLARRSRNAKSTGERDQVDLQYQRLQESRSRAGC